MRICLYSNAYAPQRGGIESVSASLAGAWHAAGHSVLLVSDTPAAEDFDRGSPFPVLRHPRWRDWRRIGREYDVVVSNGFSLKHLVKWLMAGATFWWIHSMAIGWKNPTGVPWHVKARWKIRNSLRPKFARWASGGNIFISHALKTDIAAADGPVIYNPVGSHFRPMPGTPRAADFGFFGRMWLPKGQDVMLRALAQCHAAGHHFTADFYGDGEHLSQIRQLANDLGLGQAVRFFPSLSGDDLVRAMNSVGVVVVPSTLQEPLGVVAIEAMACGKCVIGTNGGGLGEVLSDWMPTFDNGSSEQLRVQMIRMATDEKLRKEHEAAALKRAAMFAEAVIAEQYLDVFRRRLGLK